MVGKIGVLTLLIFSYTSLVAQEYVVPLQGNVKLQSYHKEKGIFSKLAPIALPFFDDFSDYEQSPYPTYLLWEDSGVYINNTFSQLQKNKGVATFDVVDKYGVTYHSSAYDNIYCDSLTSRPLLLSGESISSQVYLSFDYELQGLGFLPKHFDSLLIYFKDSTNGWVLVDYIIPDDHIGFRSAIIQLDQPGYFYDDFQFRIINKGTIGVSGSHWHIDNVYLDKGRYATDTFFNDVAFTLPSSNLLNDYTAMPFKHFNTDKNKYSNDSLKATLKNNFIEPKTANVQFMAKSKMGITYGVSSKTISLAPLSTSEIIFPIYDLTLLAPDTDNKLLIDQKYYFSPYLSDFSRPNDTITHTQVFDNYFAYDDGSAEQSYFLKLGDGPAGKIAIEFAAATPDTLAGIAIQFAPQVPSADYKEFYIQIYKSLEMGGPGGELIYEQPFNFPAPGDSANAFKTYPLSDLVPLNNGVFYVVIMMPAGGVSDSLMIGLDRNRIGGNHRYYSVYESWQPSLLEGALLIRPIMGSKTLAIPNDDAYLTNKIDVYPNPAQDVIYFDYSKSDFTSVEYVIRGVNGKVFQYGIKKGNENSINISNLPTGNYFLHFYNHGTSISSHKITKLE